MAIFNQELPATNEDFTGASKGARPDTSLGGLFENAGEFLTGAVKAGDQFFKGLIQQDVTTSVDKLRDREIGEGAGREINARTAIDPAAAKTIDESVRRMTIAKQAAEGGQIANSHYWLSLDHEARRIRSQFPGSREYIDQKFSEVTGHNPANRALELMKAEASKGNKEDTEWKHLADKAYADGGPAQEAIARGERPSIPEMYKMVYKQAKILSDAKILDKTIDASKKGEGFVASQELIGIKKNIMGGLENSISAASNSISSDWGKVQEAHRAMGDNPTRIVTADETARFNEAINTFERTRGAELNSALYKPRTDTNGVNYTWAERIGAKGVEEVTKEHNARLELELKPFKDKDFSRAARNQLYNKASENEEIATLRRSAPYVRALSAAEKLLGPQLINSIHLASPSGMDATLTFYNDHILRRALTEKKDMGSIIDDAKESMRRAGVTTDDDKKVMGTVVDSLIKTIKDPKLPPEAVNNAIHNLFSGDPLTKDWYSRTSPQDKDALYQRLVDPKIVDVLKKEESIGAYTQYRKWVETAVGEKYRESAAQVLTSIVKTDAPVGIAFQKDTLQFNPIKYQRPVATQGYNSGPNDMVAYTMTAQLAHELNQTTARYKAVAAKMDRNDEDIAHNMTAIFAAYGVDIKNIRANGSR